MIYFVLGFLLIYITLIIHKILKNFWRRRTTDRILENLEDITEYEKQKRNREE